MMAVLFDLTQDWTGGMASRAEQYRQLARDFHFMARSLPHGQNRSTLLKELWAKVGDGVKG
jgi:hypothetical protein